MPGMNKIQGSVLAVLLVGAATQFRGLRPWTTQGPETIAQNAFVEPPIKPFKSALSPAKPPDLQSLAGRLGAGVLPPTPEQIAEERRVEHEQVADALASLRSLDMDERIGGVQQLAAYPTREAERRLVKTLAADASGAVRAAAAESLAQVKKLQPDSVEALLGAMLDGDPEVRAAVLSTLQVYVNTLDPESEPFRQVRKGLAKLVKSGHLDKESRLSIKDLLKDFGD